MGSYISLNEAAKLAPGRPHVASIWRWCRRGIKTRTGGRVRLDHVRAGGKLYTSEAWLTEFFAAVAKADREHFEPDRSEPLSTPPTEKQRSRSIRRAEETLSTAGIL